MHGLALVVEDEAKIRDLVRRYLEKAGFQVLSTGSGAEAILLARQAEPDIVVLDLRLPDVPGEEVARELRASFSTRLLMLTAKAAEEDRIRGLELGADDYLTKPFSPRELVLRVQAVLRRRDHPGFVLSPRSFGTGELVLDEERHEAMVRGQPVDLTLTEWRLLTALAKAAGRPLSRYELINRVRGYEFDGYERTIDSHVKNLRRKIERDPRDPMIVVTIVGVGYRLGLIADA